MLAENYSHAPPRGFNYFLSADPTQNPAMYNYSLVYVHYCDGASYTGDRDDTVTVRNRSIYYRGRRIRDAVTRYLLTAAQGATDIVVSGTSAGGLGVYLNLDAMAAPFAQRHVRIRGLASAGFFLNTGTDYASQMATLAREQNSTPALNPRCIADAAKRGLPAESCFFPENSAAYMQTPVFGLQSRFDTWQLSHIAKQSANNASAVEAYGREIESRMAPLIARAAAPGGSGVKHAVWLSACLTHGLALVPYWTHAVTRGWHEWQAFEAWRNGSMDAVARTWVDCATYQCDHSCY